MRSKRRTGGVANGGGRNCLRVIQGGTGCLQECAPVLLEALSFGTAPTTGPILVTLARLASLRGDNGEGVPTSASASFIDGG